MVLLCYILIIAGLEVGLRFIVYLLIRLWFKGVCACAFACVYVCVGVWACFKFSRGSERVYR